VVYTILPIPLSLDEKYERCSLPHSFKDSQSIPKIIGHRAVRYAD
jgi:hypothetical protein